MGFSISWGSRGAGFLRTTKEVSGRKTKAATPRYVKKGYRSAHQDETILAIMVAGLRGARPSDLVKEYGVSPGTLKMWLHEGTRDDLMRQAEMIVPEDERRKAPRGRRVA